MLTAIVAVIVLPLSIIFARLYRRASAEQGVVRTGLGGVRGDERRRYCDANLSIRNYSDQYEYPKT